MTGFDFTLTRALRFVRHNPPLAGYYFRPMKKILPAFLLIALAFFARAEPPPAPGKTVPLFDGKTLDGWESVTPALWKVEDGCLTGGDGTTRVPHNDFLCTKASYANFVLRLKIKLTGDPKTGLINSGVQIRTVRKPGQTEVSGYQCDYGDPTWWAAIYDEGRRNKLLAPSDMKALEPVLKRGDWNEYVIRADGPRIQTWINGVQGVDYTEAEPGMAPTGIIGVQVHGGGNTKVQVKEITIEELAPTPTGAKFVPPAEPAKAAKASPLTAEEELASFTLPPGFEIELVAKEEPGIGKFITVDWDQKGRMWSMTALEYPVDGNENAAQAKALYDNPGKDKVVVFDTPSAPGVQKPRVFAEGFAIPEGILPYKDGCYIQHGPNIELLHDTDGDGKADKTEVILSGFGVQDSHLFPHQFTRAPGGWIWMAQGAFNYGKVKTTTGKETQFDQTRMAKFRPDGSDFDITSNGPCNIWGLVLDGEGQAWIQEANDFGYPVMPFHEYANYPGCSDRQWKSYAPEFPGTPGIPMGGTGLSGLALSDKGGAWPEAYADVMYVANPITRKIQAIKIHPDGTGHRLELLGDFIRSSDEMFRPISIHFGPDGCLYIVDWYNKIISHNEVPRNHPDRDKTRGRIWRVKATGQTPFAMTDFTKATGDELISKLGGQSLTQSHLAWQAIEDRGMKELAPKLAAVVSDQKASAAKRIQSAWVMEALKIANKETVASLLVSPDRNVRREAVRSLSELNIADDFFPLKVVKDLTFFGSDEHDAEVRAACIRSIGTILSDMVHTDLPNAADTTISALLHFADAPLAGPMAPSTQKNKPIKVGVAYEREFERYLVRMFLERHPATVAHFLDSPDAKRLTDESLLLATLALEPRASAARVAQLLPKLTRAPGQEEVLRLAQFLDEPGVGDALKGTLANPATRTAVLEALLATRTRLDAAKLTPLLADSAKTLLAGDDAARALALQLAAGFKLTALEPELVAELDRVAHAPRVLGEAPRLASESVSGETPATARGTRALPILRALAEIGSAHSDLFAKLATESADPLVRDEALNALASSKGEQAGKQLLALYPVLSIAQRRTAIDRLTTTKPGAQTVVAALLAGTIPKTDLDGPTLDKISTVLGPDKDLAALMADLGDLFRPVLALDGSAHAWTETGVSLDGPFTVETWVFLDPMGRPVGNEDGILGAPGQLSMNFYGALFRVYDGHGDAIIAKKPIVPNIWTHIAVTRDEKGALKIYQDGSLDQDQSKPTPQKFDNVRLGWAKAGTGTQGALSEFRIWNRTRTADEIRNDFDRSFAGQAKPPGLVFYATGSGPWGKLQSGAQVIKLSDFPPILTADEATALDAKFAKYRALADQPGDPARGKTVTLLCQACHLIQGQGGNLAPNLSGAGAMGVEALLRNIITPNAAMENGYHLFRVGLKSGDLAEGFFVSEDKSAVVLRPPGAPDRRIERRDISYTKFLRRSIMPEGLLDTMEPQQVSDLFAYLKTLK